LTSPPSGEKEKNPRNPKKQLNNQNYEQKPPVALSTQTTGRTSSKGGWALREGWCSFCFGGAKKGRGGKKPKGEKRSEGEMLLVRGRGKVW